nr:ABC transporter ATP-binding protein/permease [Lachnospiraceae bacterium]
MSFVLKYLGDYKKESILAPLFKMLEAIFELLVPLVVKDLIDVGIANGDRQYVMRSCGLLVIVAVTGLLMAITAQYYAARAAVYSAAAMRRDLFYHITSFSPETMEGQGASVMVTRMTSDLNQVQNGINMFLRLFLRSPFIVFGALIMALIVDRGSSLVFVGVIAGLSLVVWLIMRSTLPVFSNIAKMLEKLLLLVGENLEGVRVIRAFGRQDDEIGEFDHRTDKMYDAQIGAGRISAWSNPLTYLIVNLGLVVLLWYTHDRVDTGRLSQGDVVALANYMSQILVELLKLANFILLLTRAFASVERIEAVMAVEPETREFADVAPDHAAASGDEALRFSEVYFTYPGDNESAVERVSFSLKKGGTLGVVGSTGSGKSTIISLAQHHFDADSGEILIEGREAKSISDSEMSEIMAVVPQHAELFSGTIRSNLLMAREDATDNEISEALEAACCSEFVAAKSKGVDEVVLRGGTNFSGGQRQRLTIARALI